MSIRDLFKKKIKEANYGDYTPKFKVGDIILNKKFKVISKILDISDYTKLLKEEDQKYKKAEYIIYLLQDLSNPMSSVRNKKRKKTANMIDSYYEKVDERSATILYGTNNSKTESGV